MTALPTPSFTSLQQPFTQLPRKPLPLRRAIQQPTFFFYHLWDPALLPFSRTGRLELLFYFLFPLSYLMETGAKNKRPQALPRAKESVMIPTLLMNIPPEPPSKQHKSIFVLALWFFPRVFSSFFFVLFLLLRHGQQRRKSGRHTMIEDRGGKKGKMPGGTPMDACSNFTSFSRLVRSSLSFRLPCWERRDARMQSRILLPALSLSA